ncbi:phage gp6-like head-tail connector protein [Agrobacterium tumefaciens]|uniref:head-tail connector protein n=1 Tax=Agrobacterium tumefaciens TaxID=358 RepID=UPI000FC2316F|nr:phage gp6-like head-tail connector protein [Agrobacterium tumefaciens]NTE70974.1 phage gp6-like head-tail connector protein [Agrobacterium tumefaciens]
MAAVTLAESKTHLRVDFAEDDSYIAGLISAAESYVSEIGVTIASPAQPAVKHAILLLVGHWYSYREAAAEKPPQAIAFGVDSLTAPFREVSF